MTTREAARSLQRHGGRASRAASLSPATPLPETRPWIRHTLPVRAALTRWWWAGSH